MKQRIQQDSHRRQQGNSASQYTEYPLLTPRPSFAEVLVSKNLIRAAGFVPGLQLLGGTRFLCGGSNAPGLNY